MHMEFTQKRWDKIKSDSRKWWSGKLGRPLIQARLKGRKSDRKKPVLPFYEFTSFYDFSVSPEEIIDAWDYELVCTEFMGDAYPYVFPNFGPGSIAAYMGAKLKNGVDTVWFHPEKEREISKLDFNFIPDNKWFVRTKEVIHAAVERWCGEVQIGLTDLGGNMDILSSFRPSDKLMFDLFDYPEEVERLIWKAHQVWWIYFEEFNSITKNINPGYSSWSRIFSCMPHYTLQCDFCFMISPDMFDKFVKPELVATSERLTNVFYHLDGPGQLVHLDSLLDIASIHGIQWVPGAGQADVTGWSEVYQKITNAGKLIHISSNMADDPFTVIDDIANKTGRADNIVYHFDGNESDRNKAEKMLLKYNCI